VFGFRICIFSSENIFNFVGELMTKSVFVGVSVLLLVTAILFIVVSGYSISKIINSNPKSQVSNLTHETMRSELTKVSVNTDDSQEIEQTKIYGGNAEKTINLEQESVIVRENKDEQLLDRVLGDTSTNDAYFQSFYEAEGAGADAESFTRLVNESETKERHLIVPNNEGESHTFDYKELERLRKYSIEVEKYLVLDNDRTQKNFSAEETKQLESWRIERSASEEFLILDQE